MLLPFSRLRLVTATPQPRFNPYVLSVAAYHRQLNLSCTFPCIYGLVYDCTRAISSPWSATRLVDPIEYSTIIEMLTLSLVPIAKDSVNGE